MPQQSTNHLLMVEPAAFGCNPETASTNHYQQASPHTEATEIQTRALREFRGLRDALIEHGVCVTTMKGQPDSPDDLFPNNWVSTHEEGHYCLYPMHAVNRRLERRLEIIRWLETRYTLHTDFSSYEKAGQILESTGSMVLDRVNRVAYACLSARMHAPLFQHWCDTMGYRGMTFEAMDEAGRPIYHTNVMMFIGTQTAGICLEALPEAQRERVRAELAKSHRVVELSLGQIAQFAGNALEVQTLNGRRYWVMSQQAREALTPEQLAHLQANGEEIILAPLETIERHGGGSARCMLLELF